MAQTAASTGRASHLLADGVEHLRVVQPQHHLQRGAIERDQSDNVANPSLPGLSALGIEATSVEAIVPSYLYRYRKGGQYADLVKPA